MSAVRKKRSASASGEKVAKSGAKFSTLATKIPTRAFAQMVSKSGIPTPEARELVLSFKELKGE